MTATADKLDRVSRRQVDKFEERRRELASAALLTLSELGYARTSLREIAQNSAFSHGVLHYYFRDKNDLITYCVRQYKAQCAQRYDQVVAESPTADALAAGFADAMIATLREDGHMHRLWYDLRSQALFTSSFRSDVLEIDELLEQMIWRVVSRYAELAAVAEPKSSALTYALFDGVFQHALLRHLAGLDVAPTLHSDVLCVLGTVVPRDTDPAVPEQVPATTT
ncbi:TetR/AcrR family transcriptional regulator [Pseudonocardia sp. TRM90224]|uniref:TetR/AcrR family transcriptional regulator n=1 Tax=Pseudonocardia sp. TRM90224 TaxID=2812678 RepID=UPI001E342914|nr:TetR/AcrR family transcriptional regulator [Pseudonocardia sp. TRM90224]